MSRKSPQQKLARVIQTATGNAYHECLRQAHIILGSIGENDEKECGDRLQDWICTLAPGPHARWRHLDEEKGAWWQQSGVFPYSNAVEPPPRGPHPDLVILDEAIDTCPNCLGPLLAGGEHFSCKPVDHMLSEGSADVCDATRERFGPPFLKALNKGGPG